MPTKLLFALRRAGPVRQADPPPAPARIAPVMAALVAILLTASTDRLAAFARAELTPRPEAPLAGAILPPTEAPRLAARPRHVDALVTALARKYRVSDSATREMVDAAYLEAGRNGLDPLLVIAVIAVESRFNPIAQSDGGALGLMQVIPRYHGDKFDAASGESMLDPRVNIQVGAAVLREYIRRGGTEIAGLQLYNGAQDDETSAYAHKVLAEKQRLQSVIRRGA